MTLQEFSRLAATFGADSMRWPAELREPAAVLLAGSAEARAVLERAARLDALLRRHPLDVPAWRAARVTEATLARIAAAPRVRGWAPFWRWPAAFIPPAPAALAALAVIGCLLGMLAPLPSAPLREPMISVLGLLAGDEDGPL